MQWVVQSPLNSAFKFQFTYINWLLANIVKYYSKRQCKSGSAHVYPWAINHSNGSSLAVWFTVSSFYSCFLIRNGFSGVVSHVQQSTMWYIHTFSLSLPCNSKLEQYYSILIIIRTKDLYFSIKSSWSSVWNEIFFNPHKQSKFKKTDIYNYRED